MPLGRGRGKRLATRERERERLATRERERERLATRERERERLATRERERETTSCWPLTDGSDYIGINETFTISPGERRCFNITVVDDVVAERSTERVNVLLTSAGPPHTFSEDLYFYIRDNEEGWFHVGLP